MREPKHQPDGPISLGSRYRRRHEKRGDSTSRFPRLPDFDAQAWSTMLEEQKLAIARAAGVDPSKVRIQVGH